MYVCMYVHTYVGMYVCMYVARREAPAFKAGNKTKQLKHLEYLVTVRIFLLT